MKINDPFRPKKKIATVDQSPCFSQDRMTLWLLDDDSYCIVHLLEECVYSHFLKDLEAVKKKLSTLGNLGTELKGKL